MTLIEYLSQLNSSETQWRIWVHPENTDNYRCCQYDGPDGWISIGTPDSLSFGFQDTRDAIYSYLTSCGDTIEFNGEVIPCDREELISGWENDELPEGLGGWLEEQSEDIKAATARVAAEFFVRETLPEIIEQAKKCREAQLAEYALGRELSELFNENPID